MFEIYEKIVIEFQEEPRLDRVQKGLEYVVLVSIFGIITTFTFEV